MSQSTSVRFSRKLFGSRANIGPKSVCEEQVLLSSFAVTLTVDSLQVNDHKAALAKFDIRHAQHEKALECTLSE